MNRALRDDKLLQTAQQTCQRIDNQFPKSGLSGIAAEVVQITTEAVERAEAIRRPILWLRAGLVILLVIAFGGIVTYALTGNNQKPPLIMALEFLQSATGSAAILTAIALFFVTLENRLKRRRALKAIHELRAVAHIIDMHQLTKSIGRFSDPTKPITVAGKPMNADSIGAYLHFCTDLLALISKIGQLYVQDFQDATAQAAVDQFEALSTGLSSKIWQKLVILSGTGGKKRGRGGRTGLRSGAGVPRLCP